MKRALSLIYYRKGLAEAGEDEEQSFDDLCYAFLERLSAEIAQTGEFLSFFRYQLRTYLKGKGSNIVSLAEGDMVSDLIADSYISFLDDMESSPFNINPEGRRHLLESLDIIFPEAK